MTEGEPKKAKKKTVWKNVFDHKNPDTGAKYFKRRKVVVSESSKGENSSSKIEIRPPLTKEERGSFNADIVSKAMDERDEEKERAVRKSMDLPDDED
ncbi:hypothetical protein KKH23_02600 [Patescibacteria group bacterium]|nr:hypothetical protein [Patescibacteria group bacterium]MBU0777427.1 hypothetical protein [Patescibacteria group bacterium]MBU0846063.1 hypothetical protein [Patescibacteria group bacterium]MBU0923115.1 hypothetical protein [Patescibacteria group bacterium]MBU1066830.1 hypothetical protein [Patescibacteria group bacterium]